MKLLTGHDRVIRCAIFVGGHATLHSRMHLRSLLFSNLTVSTDTGMWMLITVGVHVHARTRSFIGNPHRVGLLECLMGP